MGNYAKLQFLQSAKIEFYLENEGLWEKPASHIFVDKCRTLIYICLMLNAEMNYEFSTEKNQALIEERGISFEEVIAAIEMGAVIDVIPHPNLTKYPNQKMYILNINNYICAVPFVRKDHNTVFLKTIFFNRKLTKKYLKEGSHENPET